MGLNWWRDDEISEREVSVQEIVDRVRAEQRREHIQADDARAVDDGLWPRGWPHEAPEHPMGVIEAHTIMQRHRGCRVPDCPRKAAAQQVLIDAGRMTPDTSRTR